ncbi:MAG: glycosyltransferase family 39 protein [Dehalococcoidia bacterium]|nr:glycosyltransferase family 39 protein [Dehalococcoidia bacterium]
MPRLIGAPYFYPLALIFIGAFSFLLRIYRLDAQSLRGDEILGVLAIRGPFTDMFASEALVDHPPLYFLILRLWLAVAGQSDFAIRFLSVACGTLTVPIVYHIGRRLIARHLGLLAAIIAAVSPFSVIYGQEARAYALALLLATASVYLVVRLFEQADMRLWLLWAFVALLALFSEYLAGQIVLFEEVFVFLFLLARQHSLWRRWLLVQVIIFGPLIPWLYFSRAVANVYAYDSAPWGMNLGEMLRDAANAFSIGNSLTGQVAVGFIGLFVGLALIGLLDSRRHLRFFLFSVGYLCLPIALTYAVSLGVLGFSARHLLVAIPAFFLMVAGGLDWLRRRSWLLFTPCLALVLAGSGISLANYYHDSSFGREELRSTAQYVADRVRPDDLVVFTAPWGEKMFRYYSDAPFQTTGVGSPNQRDPGQIETRLEEVVPGHDRVWLVIYDPVAADPQATVSKWLDKNTYALGTKGFQGLIVRSFLTKSPITTVKPISQRPVDVSFGQRMLLVGYDVNNAEAPTKGRIYLTLYWQGLQPMKESYRVQVRLIDEQQRVWAIRDLRPVFDTFLTSRWTSGLYIRDEYELDLLAGTPPGTYNAVVQVYDADDGRTLTTERGVSQMVVGGVEVARRVVPPPLDRHDMQVRTQQTFSEIELLGYSVFGRSDQRGTRLEAKGGDEITVSTLWRAKTRPTRNLSLSLQLTGQGQTIRSDQNPVGGTYPSGRWEAGEVIRDFQTLIVDPELPAGSYRLLATVDGGEQIGLSMIDLKKAERSNSQATGENSVGRSFGGIISLLGYDLRPAPGLPLQPGNTMALDLYWKAESKVGTRYTVFTHLVDATEKIVAQQDGEPGQGAYSTTGWLPGDVIADRRRLAIDSKAEPGIYRLFVGLYDAQTGQRLTLADGNDRLLLGTIRINSDR